jgi:hypothetical protein
MLFSYGNINGSLGYPLAAWNMAGCWLGPLVNGLAWLGFCSRRFRGTYLYFEIFSVPNVPVLFIRKVLAGLWIFNYGFYMEDFIFGNEIRKGISFF